MPRSGYGKSKYCLATKLLREVHDRLGTGDSTTSQMIRLTTINKRNDEQSTGSRALVAHSWSAPSLDGRLVSSLPRYKDDVSTGSQAHPKLHHVEPTNEYKNDMYNKVTLYNTRHRGIESGATQNDENRDDKRWSEQMVG